MCCGICRPKIIILQSRKVTRMDSIILRDGSSGRALGAWSTVNTTWDSIQLPPWHDLPAPTTTSIYRHLVGPAAEYRLRPRLSLQLSHDLYAIMAPLKKRTPKARSSRKKKTAKLQLTGVAANTDTLHCCLVCFKDQPLSAFPDVGNTGNHDHDNNTCRKCFNRYTVDQIKSGKDEIRCCECAEHLTYDQVKTIISKTSLITYDKVLAKACVESDADFRYCLSEKCKSGQIQWVAQSSLFSIAVPARNNTAQTARSHGMKTRLAISTRPVTMMKSFRQQSSCPRSQSVAPEDVVLELRETVDVPT